jgi:VWFA-related protein
MASTLRTIAYAGLLTATLSASAGQNPQEGQTAGQTPPAEQQPSGQTPSTTQPPPTFRGGINFVRVDVIVNDRSGNTVADLQMGDFEVTEDGRPQTIETFKLIQLDGGLMPAPDGPPRAIRSDSDEEAEAARDDVRLFAIFLDDYHVRSTTSLNAREAVARFIETQLGPSDMVGVMYPLEPAGSVRFTRDHAAVQRTVMQFLGRKYDYTPQNSIEESYVHYPTETVEQIRNQVSLSAINALASRMGGLKEGRKSLIVLSEGYNALLPPQLRSPDARTGMIDAGNIDPMAGESMMEQRAAAFANFDLEADLRNVADTANKNNVAIYTLDPRGLALGEFDAADNISLRTSANVLNSTMDTLRTLAERTDGRAIVNRNDLTLAMRQIVRDSSAYYLLGYSSTEAPTDGEFHEIRVRVKRPGVQVRSRPGYWAITATEAAAIVAPRPGPPKAVEAALAAITVPARGRLIRTWIGNDPGENGKTKVTFVWEPVPRLPGEAARASDEPARVALTASGEDGTPYFRGRTPDTARRVSFEVPPGPLQLRIAVEGRDAETLDSEVRQVTVPDMAGAEIALSSAEVFRARTPREAQQIKASPDALPSLGREFSRSDRLLVRIRPSGVRSASAKLTARLLNRGGQAIVDVPVAAGQTGDAFIDLSLGSMAPGEYVLEITAAGGTADVQELVGFRVTG